MGISMADILTKILDTKRLEVEDARRRVPEESLEVLAESAPGRRGFLERLSRPGPGGVNIIAEIKRGSPSLGIILDNLDPENLARCYEHGGAAALSVLTDRTYFQAAAGDLARARAAVRLPVLRKDFIVSTYQVYESAVMGADAVLLIVRALSPALLQSCLDLCGRLNLDALVEVHSEEELDLASEAGARIIGINNRDLATFRTDIRKSVNLARKLVPGQTAVAESGIHERAQVETLLDAGIRNFLIGESLVRSVDPSAFLRYLCGLPVDHDPGFKGNPGSNTP